MATIEARELDTLRQGMAAEAADVNYSKPQVNAMLQAIEDWFSKAAVQASLNTDIEAVAPGAFTATQKRRAIKYWLRHRFGKE